MKALKVLSGIALAAVVALPAFADQTYHVGGSTAFRSAVHNAIVNLMSANSGTCHVAYSGSNLASANLAVFQGTIAGLSGTTTVECSWNGSLTGVSGVTKTATGSFNTFKFLTAANISTGTASAGTQPNNPGTTTFSSFGLLPGPTLASGASAASTTFTTETVAPDLALSDAAVTSTPFKPSNGYSSVVDTKVGVLPFLWIKNAAVSTDVDFAGWGRITNITSLQVQALLSEGSITASDITQNSADGFVIAPAGRDYDSGTRFDTIAEAYQTNTKGTTPITQFTDNGGTATADGSGFFVNTLGTNASGPSIEVSQTSGANNEVTSSLSTTLPAGGGFNSGGKLDASLQDYGTDSAPDFGGYVVGYTGAQDADTVLNVTTGGPTGYNAPLALTFNGVALSEANVANGTYSFWVFEHFLTKTTLSTDNGGFSNKLFTQLLNTDAAVAGYKTSVLNSTVAGRTSEGSEIPLP